MIERAAIFITARMKSTRLPFKVTRQILGIPMIVHMISRLRLARLPEQIVICTSSHPQDDCLVDIARQAEVKCFRGSEDDVLLRLASAAQEISVDHVISCTADNPFVDPEYIDRLLAFHIEAGNDYSKIEGLPWGTFAYAVSASALRRACEVKDETDTEVWGGYFTGTGLFKCGVLEVMDGTVRWPDLRLTVDTEPDFELVTKIFECLYQPDRIFSLREIVALCHDRPDLVAINAHIKQKGSRPIRIHSDWGAPHGIDARGRRE